MSLQTDIVEITIFDVAGKLIETVQYEAKAGNNTFSIDVSRYAVGTYTAVLRTGTFIEPLRFVKQD